MIEWKHDDSFTDGGYYTAEVDEGSLFAYLTPDLPATADELGALGCWMYAIELGHRTGGTRLDPPDWHVDIEVDGWAESLTDAKWKAERHYARLMVADDVARWEEAAAEDAWAAQVEADERAWTTHG